MSKTKTEKLAEIDVKIAKLRAERAEVEAGPDREFDISDVKAGDSITFIYGRSKEQRSGTVLGVNIRTEGQKGADFIKVLTGEGFDAEVVTTYPAAIVAVVGA